MRTKVKPTLNKNYQMISVSNKKNTFRRALAQGRITLGKEAFDLIKAKQLPKGDALVLAEVAGILGAKKAHEMIPLCHPLGLDHVGVYTELNEESHSVMVYCVVSATAKTGVEMEALAGTNAALLSIYDLAKMVEPALSISDVRLLFKEGGKKGFWTHPDGMPDFILEMFCPPKKKPYYLNNIKTAVITASDRASSKQYEDKSGPVLTKVLAEKGANICDYTVLPDNKEQLTQHIYSLLENHAPRLIVLTGGTGLDPKDITPEVIEEVCERIVPGFGELLRHDGARYHNERAWLSRCLAGSVNNTLIIALPGSPKAVAEGIDIMEKILPHALYMVAGGKHD